ncbi:MAG TPA: DUF5666 domain-containing protein [Methylomirabilota bacterium]
MRAVMIASTALAAVLTLLPLASARAEMIGRLQHIEPASRTLYFTDGRIVTLAPGASVWVDGRQIPIEALQSGMTIVIGGAPAPRLVQPAPAAKPMADGYHASGTIARIDEANRIVTFQDGRSVKLAPGTRIWEASDLDDIHTGERVMIEGGQLAAYGPVGDLSSERTRMGRVIEVDRDRSMALLEDGTWIGVTPTTRMRVDGRDMVTQLQPGDEVIVVLAPPMTATAPRVVVTPGGTPVPSALPRDALQEAWPARILHADTIHIFRRPQSP